MNPEGLPERVLREVTVMEFGPVTWGAYPDATAQLGAPVLGVWSSDTLTCSRNVLEFRMIEAKVDLESQKGALV